MSLSTVTWRQAVAAIAATFVVLLGAMVVVRADGLAAVDAASARATAWFVHQPTGRVVLVDGYRGSALASIAAGAPGEQITVADGASGAFVLNDTTAEARPIDTVDLRLGTSFGLTSLGDGRAMSGVGQAGLVVVNRGENDATVVPADGEPVSFSVESGTASEIARDGAIWSLVEGDLVRTTSSSVSRTELGVNAALLTVIGSDPIVVDVENRRVRVGTGDWQSLPTDADPSEIIAQAPGPAATCGWVAANDDLWCVGADGIEESASIDGLDIDGGDLLAIAGDAAAVVRRGPSSIVRFDWRAETILEDVSTRVDPAAELQVVATTDLVWVDEVGGRFVYAVNPWSINAINKNAQGILELGEDGEIVDAGESSSDGSTTGQQNQEVSEPELREPDDNGIDDDPVAVDDAVTARSGSPVSVEVTANDYDPDGEAVAVSAVDVPGHGSVDIGTATTVVYTPDAGYVGVDQFDYTIVDGNGSEATASVSIELLAVDATNKPPVGVVDTAETGANVSVVIDVLRNDVDPERDALRIGGFSPPEARVANGIGEVTETEGDSGLPALEFTPAEGFEGTAIFSYRPVDAFDAVGDDVEVRVEVARDDDPNRPPIARPDAVRLRRNVITHLQVLLNDADSDGDDLTVTLPDSLPEGLEVEVEGAQLAITARAGAPAFAPFEYEIDDGHGHTARGAVLVSVIDDIEPNRPPLVSADSDKVVVGESVVIDVTANDVDPDGDPLTVVAVTQPASGPGKAVIFNRSAIQFSPGMLDDESTQASVRFTYTVSDGNGHEVVGDVTVTALPEALDEPPFARDDSTFTYQDVPVTVDVLRNDGDASGGRPSLVGTPGCPGGGKATVMADSQVRLDPPDGFTGSFRCNYEITNASGRRASAAIIVSVRERQITNLPPVAVIDFLSVEIGKSASIDVTDNDTDPDGASSALEVLSSTAPVIGTAQRSGNVIRFTAGSVTGQATINYQVADEDGAVSLGQLQVSVTERKNVAPIASADAKTIFGPGVPTPFDVLSNDSDPDNTPGGVSVVSANIASGDGTVSLSGNILTIIPNPGFLGQVVASYVMRDGEGMTASSTATLTIEKLPNRAPEARDDSNEVINGGSVSASVLYNDVDPDGDPLSLSILSGPDAALGTASVGTSGSINFSAAPGASGTAVIAYQISDGQLTDDAVLRITVYPCAESAPVAPGGFLKTGYQQPIAVDLAAFAANGTIVDVSGPAGYDGAIYTPPAGENANVVINYSVVNSCRMRANGQVTIDVNQDPSAQPVSINVDTGTERTIAVSDLATDQEVLTISGSTGAPAWVETLPDRLVLRPPVGTTAGTSSWTTRVVDPGGLAATVSVTVTVGNRPPVANPDTIDASGGGAVNAPIVNNDTDPSADAGKLMIASIPSTITFANGATGTVTVVDPAIGRQIIVDPGAGEGTATFTYTVKSITGEVSAPATVTVNGPAPPPPSTTVPPTTTPPTTTPPTTVPATTVPPTSTTPTTTTPTTTTTPPPTTGP